MAIMVLLEAKAKAEAVDRLKGALPKLFRTPAHTMGAGALRRIPLLAMAGRLCLSSIGRRKPTMSGTSLGGQKQAFLQNS